MSQLVIGIDSSTQSVSAVVLDIANKKIVHEAALNFSASFPHYQTSDGVLRNEDPNVVHAPPLMWVEALDALLLQLKDAIDMSSVIAVAGSGQQHDSVYLKSSFAETLQQLNPAQAMHEQIADQFSRATSPIWMDSSTSNECAALAADCGGEEALCAATGSVAIERFTGAQIKKFAEQEPTAYAETATVSLVSSFMASLLAGKIIGIDYGDASGMNTFDLRSRQWFDKALDSCGAALAEKLQAPADPRNIVGALSAYAQARYGFSVECQLLPFSGDNPCSLIGLGLVDEGMTAISLGTSDTVFGHMQDLPESMSPWAHTFVAPTNHYMLLLCFKNGSLAREAVRKQFDLDWDAFTAAIEASEPGNNAGFMLPWFDSEIVPKVLSPGIHVQGLDQNSKEQMCRGVVESQFLSMRNHAAEAGLMPSSIRATGGASNNRAILQIMADVFQCPVDVMEISNGAAMGAALRALQGVKQLDWSEAVAGFTDVQAEQRIEPRTQYADLYAQMGKDYAAFEATQM